MVAITKLKLDERGRISFPNSFLLANGIKKGTYVEVHPVYNRSDSVRIQFEWDKKDNEEDK